MRVAVSYSIDTEERKAIRFYYSPYDVLNVAPANHVDCKCFMRLHGELALIRVFREYRQTLKKAKAGDG